MNNNLKIEISEVFQNDYSKREVYLLENFIFWLEKVENDDFIGNAIFARPFNQEYAVPQNLIGNGFYLKSNFHGYGGKSYQCIQNNGKIYLIWFDQITKSLWMQIFEESKRDDHKDNIYLQNYHTPIKLTNSIDFSFEQSFVMVCEKILVGIAERNDKDYLFSLDITKKNQDLFVLKNFDNFAGYLSSYSGSNFISFIEWDKPNMPWQNNDLVLISFSKTGHIEEQEIFNKESLDPKNKIAFFQPYWLDCKTLVCSEDSSGWWNLLFLEIEDGLKIKVKKRFIKNKHEYGVPKWVSGLSLFSGTKENFFCLNIHKNTWILEHYQDLIFKKHIKLPFTYLSALHANNNKLIFFAANSTLDKQLIELDLEEKNKKIIENTQKWSMVDNCVSKSESFWFKGYKNKKTHSWIYRPLNNYFDKPPLMLKAHSGPTSRFDGVFDKEVQFWSSRGWLVAEVNYGGSTGYGREYRERLDEEWGLCDAYDCINLTLELINKKLVDSSRLVICGNSAGGLTALNSICYSNLFKGAICKYPVLDLENMRYETHRFERDYLNSLLGQYPKNQDSYIKRSPINNIEEINSSVLFFHGKKDLVISYDQTLKFHKRLLDKEIYSEIRLYDNEGHGFKHIDNKIDFLRTSELFTLKIFDN